MCRIGCGEPCFPARFKLRSRHFRLHLLPDSACLHAREGTDLVRIGRSHQVEWLAFRSCRTSNLFLMEFTAVDPHTVEQNGEFAGDGNNRASATFGTHQSHAP